MLSAYIKIYLIFFKIGLFTIGGGLAALPLLQNEAIMRNWLTNDEFINIIAISQSTPGPIGVNMSTYVGYTHLGIVGSIIASLGFVSPSVIIIVIISRFLDAFRENAYIKSVFLVIRPAVVALICVAAYRIGSVTFINQEVMKTSIVEAISCKAIIMFFGFMYFTNKYKHHPIVYIIIAAIIGIIVF